MTEFYNLQQLNQTRKKLLQKYSILALVALIAVTLYLLSFYLHKFLLTFLIGCIGVCASIIFFYYFVSPTKNENSLMKNILEGKSEKEQLCFLEFGDAIEREGVPCNKVLMQGVDPKGRAFERELFLAQGQKMPPIIKGEQVEVTTYQSIITSIKKV